MARLVVSGAATVGAPCTRLTNIEDIAPLLVFLAGDGHWITGQTILANGGYTTR